MLNFYFPQDTAFPLTFAKIVSTGILPMSGCFFIVKTRNANSFPKTKTPLPQGVVNQT
jgi:hypothetical protein